MTICLLSSLLACTKDEPQEPEVELFIDEELVLYFDAFREEAALRGIEVDYEALNLEGRIENIRDRDVLGQCRVNSAEPDEVVIDEFYWNGIDDDEREFIVFHELGHCVLNRDHLDTSSASGRCLSIMHSGTGRCRFTYNASTRSGYLDELFSN